jgi:hypothetical protein
MTYSFLNISAFIVGPGIAVNMASGAAAAEEGIDIEAAEDKNKMDIGADGQGQHSLIASDAKTITARFLKTSPVNALLQAAYDIQSTSSLLWGKNVITVTDSARGDVTVATQVAFKKDAPKKYAKEAGMMEWVFDCISANSVLGNG